MIICMKLPTSQNSNKSWGKANEATPVVEERLAVGGCQDKKCYFPSEWHYLLFCLESS